MPVDLRALQEAFAREAFLLTEHASVQAARRTIDSREMAEAVANGDVIEDYPGDKYGPSCLILGRTTVGRVLHLQVSYPPDVKVITVYEPTLERWSSDFKARRGDE